MSRKLMKSHGLYVAGLMWTMLTLTIGMPDPQPMNSPERMFAIFVPAQREIPAELRDN